MPQLRADFPGLVCLEHKDTPTHWADVCRIKDGGNSFVLDLIRNKQSNGSFLCSRVSNTSKQTLWDFKHQGFDGVGLLAQVSDRVVVALVGRNSGRVEQVVPLSSLVPSAPRLDVGLLLTLKAEAATYLGKGYSLTPTEELMESVLTARRAEVAAQRVAAITEEQRAENARRVEERQRRVADILGRPKVLTYAADGSKRHGHPVVVGDEWKSLDHGTYVVLVGSYQKDKVGEPIEAFMVTKAPGRDPAKGRVVSVTLANPKAVQLVKPVGQALIERNERFFTVVLYRTKEEIDTARDQGLNSGTFAAVDTAPKLNVVEVHHNGIQSVGTFARIG